MLWRNLGERQTRFEEITLAWEIYDEDK